MNYVKSLPVLLCTIAIISFSSCIKEQVSDLPENLEQKEQTTSKLQTEQMSAEQLSAFNSKMVEVKSLTDQNKVVSLRAPVNYLAQLCSTPLSATHQTVNSINNADFWDFYTFVGNAGDAVSIHVARTAPGMDPSISVYFGTTTSTTGVNTGNGGPDMTFLAFADDNTTDPFNSCYDDPTVNLVLPYTGTYTLTVHDFLSCGTPLEYVINTTGIVCDADGDGCEDFNDPHPNSDQTATVVIDGCDSEVANVFITGCSTMSDLIADCAASAADHGEFVSCASALTNAWKDAGLISGRDKGKIQACAAQANLP